MPKGTPTNMNKAIFISKRMVFDKKNASFIDMVMGHMAIDIERVAKMNVPVKTGALRSEIRHSKNRANGHWLIEANKEYAAYQELGMRRDGSYKVRNYSTSGTGKHWFKNAIDKAINNRKAYIQEARQALGL